MTRYLLSTDTDSVFWDKSAEVVRRAEITGERYDLVVAAYTLSGRTVGDGLTRNLPSYLHLAHSSHPHLSPSPPPLPPLLSSHPLLTLSSHHALLTPSPYPELPSDAARQAATQLLFELVDEGGLLVVLEAGNPQGTPLPPNQTNHITLRCSSPIPY